MLGLSSAGKMPAARSFTESVRRARRTPAGSRPVSGRNGLRRKTPPYMPGIFAITTRCEPGRLAVVGMEGRAPRVPILPNTMAREIRDSWNSSFQFNLEKAVEPRMNTDGHRCRRICVESQLHLEDEPCQTVLSVFIRVYPWLTNSCSS